MDGDGVLAHNGARQGRANKLTTVCPFILGNEFCERLAFYGLATNLSIYLTTVMGLQDATASIQVSLFSGTAYITPLLGAWLADGYWGRFRTIMAFSVVYAVGMFGMAATALVPGLSPTPSTDPNNRPVATTTQLALFYVFLYIVSVGTGGIKPNVSAFGADQFNEQLPDERAQKQSFFNYFYLAINVGSLLASTVIVGIQTTNWGLGFAIPAFSMAIAVVVFYAGSSRYTYSKPTGSPFDRVLSLSLAALRQRMCQLCGCRPQYEGQRYGPDDDEEVLLQEGGEEGRKRDALDIAGEQLGLRADQVEETRLVLRMGPIFLLSILYWAMYSQMASVFVIQASHMDLRVYIHPGQSFKIPPASMSTFDTISIIVLVPIYDGILKPLLKQAGRELSMLQRIGWGFLFVAAAMAWAGHVEEQRMAAVVEGRNISVLLQSTQYVLVGVSEVLASIGQIEFFYDQAPDVMRSCCLAMQLLSTSLGGYLSAIILALVRQYSTWLQDLSSGGSRLDLYFYLLAIGMLVNTVIFGLVTMNWKYKDVKHSAPGGAQRPPRAGAAGAVPAMDIRAQRPGFATRYTTEFAEAETVARSVTMRPQTPIYPPNFR